MGVGGGGRTITRQERKTVVDFSYEKEWWGNRGGLERKKC